MANVKISVLGRVVVSMRIPVSVTDATLDVVVWEEVELDAEVGFVRKEVVA